MSEFKVCSRCIYDSNIPRIHFDDKGVCNYCHQVDFLLDQYKTGLPEGQEKLNQLIDEIKKAGANKPYDCVIGVSGGTDSSYLLIKAVEWGLRPLAVHYDNTWNSAIASENIRKVTKYCNVDLSTYVIDNKEADDIFRSFFLAGVPEFDASTDIAYAQVLRQVAAKHGVKYIFEGHSFTTEGVSPQGNNYFDGKYIEDIHKKYGRMKMKTYPNMTFTKFLKSILVDRIKFLRPLWYLEYSKDEAREFLQKNTGWTYYGGHHLENRSAAFLHAIYNPQKFNIDNRNWTLAASARRGALSREEALEIYNTPITGHEDLVEYFLKRTGLTQNEYQDVMKGQKRSAKDFKTYKKRFEKMRPFFYVMAKANLVPMSFYLKYCFPPKENAK